MNLRLLDEEKRDRQLGMEDRVEQHHHWVDREGKVVQRLHLVDTAVQGFHRVGMVVQRLHLVDKVEQEPHQADKEEHWQPRNLEDNPFQDPLRLAGHHTASQMTWVDQGEDILLGQLEDSSHFGIQEQAVAGIQGQAVVGIQGQAVVGMLVEGPVA